MFISLDTHDDEESRFRQECGTQIFVVQTPQRNSAAKWSQVLTISIFPIRTDSCVPRWISEVKIFH